MGRLRVQGPAVVALLCLVYLSGLVSSVAGAYCHAKPDPDAQPNLQPITQPEPVFVRSVPNAALYTVAVDDQDVPIVHLWGTPYEKGLAHGTLMKDRMAGFIGDVLTYLINQAAIPLNQSGMSWPEAQKVAATILNDGLDLTSAETGPFTGAYYGEEIQGMADGSGVDVNTIRRLQMLGELTKGSCSMFGAWDDSLAGGDGLLTMRALDWISDGPFQNFHQITVYHADTTPRPVNDTTPLENTFVTMGWTGWVGSITGVNEHALSIHEIGASFPDASFGNESTQGVPFTYVLRDILQFDRTRLDGVSRLAEAHRTCNLILGVGDGKDRRFNSMAYSATSLQIMDDSNQKPVADWHPTINSTVYHAMDWLCPSFNSVMGAQIDSLWGELTPELAIAHIMPIVQTGNLHIFVADLVAMQLYVSFLAPDSSTSKNRKAFDRQYAQLDLPSLFAVQQEAEPTTADEEISFA